MLTTFVGASVLNLTDSSLKPYVKIHPTGHFADSQKKKYKHSSSRTIIKENSSSYIVKILAEQHLS